MNCVNTSTSTFKELAKRNNISESKLELIVHQYWLEDEGNTEFPSDVYIQAQLGNTKYREPSKAVREVWKTKYSKPQEFSSLKEVQQAVTEAQKFFPPSVIVYYKNNNGTFTLSVRQPVASLKHFINDFFKEGTSLDEGHFRTPLKGNQREQLFNIHDGIKRQLMFMEEDQVKETLKTQIQNSDIPKETVEKISSAIDKMTKKQILSEIELMDREKEDFNIVLQDLREAGESIRFQQEKQEPASAIEDEIQFSVGPAKNTFTFADGTVVETPFKLNNQQADALNAMNAFLHSNEAVMTLSGYAGTGKTSLMEILADKAKKDGISIKFTASTNKAAKVLKNRVFEKGFIAQTLHKLFAYELAQDETTEYDAKKHVITRLEENAKYRPGDVIVIDEASMINDGLYRDIVEDARNNHLKIIFVGDKKQLAPVGQKTISSVFKNNQSKVVELTKVERTGDNAILAEATRLRTDIPLTGISSFNSKGQGVAYMSKQKREELERIIRYFAPNIKANPDYFRILAWSNNVVSEYNNMVRSILGYSSYVPQVGEPMMGYTNWGYKRNASPMEDPYDLVNSESYKVVAVGNPQTLKKSFVRVADGKNVTVEVESIPITLENSVGEVKNFDYIDVKQNAKNRNSAIILAQQKADLWNKYRTAPRGRADTYGTKGWYAARAGEIERFLFVNDDITKSNPRDPNKPITLQAKVIDFGYAMTVHKSQGSTFTHVLVDDVNISKASGFEDNAPSTSPAGVSSEDLKTANETIEPVGPKKKLNIPGLANLLSKKSSQPETLMSQAPAPKPANTNPDAADIVQQLKYVAVSRATDTVTIISDNVKKEDSPLNHINEQQATQQDNNLSNNQQVINTEVAISEAEGFIGEVDNSPYKKVGSKFVLRNDTPTTIALNTITDRGHKLEKGYHGAYEGQISYNVGYTSGSKSVMSVTNRDLYDEGWEPSTIMIRRESGRLNQPIESQTKTQIEQFPEATFIVEGEDIILINYLKEKGYSYKVYSDKASSKASSENISQFKLSTSETWQKAQAIQEPSGRRPVEYTSPGQPARTYYVEGEHIYNDKGKEVYNAPQMRTHKNKILFKLAYKEGRAVIINLKGNRYIVDRYQNILSVKTGEVMMWGDENGDKRDILALAENAFKDKLNATQTSPQQPQQNQSQQTFTTETALGDKVQVSSIEQALAIQQLYEMFDEMEEGKFEELKNKILNASPEEVSKINIPMSSAVRKRWNDRKQEVQQQIQQESKDVQPNSPQQSQTRSLGEKETVSQAMEKTIKTLDDWLEYSRAHIKVDKENHKYYIDGEAADYSVTEYAESIFGKPDIKGDYSHSSAIGNMADAIYRDYFDPTKDVYALSYPNTNAERKAKMIQDAQRLEAYLDKVHGVKDGVRQYKVITREFPIAARFDTPNGMKTIAGTMDMIVIDKNGDIWIYDFKAKNHPITQTYYGKEVSDRRNYTAQQNLYRAILDANSAFEGQVKGLNLVWMDTAYPKLSEAQYKTDKKTGEVTVVVADGRTLNIPLAEYDGFKTPSLKPNIEDSIIPLNITDDIENLHIPELHAMDFITKQVVDYIKSLGIPVHTREELIQYLKDHGYENIQQVFEEQHEMQDIRERAIKNGQIKIKADGSFDYALAPNGKPSNLNERQWLQVRTKPFINWFGDWINDPANASKVVDENGEPLVVYHGSSSEFTQFDKNLLGTNTGASSAKLGFFFSKTYEASRSYIGDLFIREDYLGNYDVSIPELEQLENLYYQNLDDLYNEYNYEYISKEEYDSSVKELKEKYEAKKNKIFEKVRLNNSKVKSFFLNIKNISSFTGTNAQNITDNINKAISDGADGVVLKEVKDPTTTDDYVAFSPNQIKSATDNIGTFSTENDDIQMMAEDNNKLIQTLKIIEEAIKTGNWTDDALEELENLNLDNYGKILKRFSQEELRSSNEILAQAETIITRGNGRTNASNPSSNRERTEQQEQQIETWAKENGLWYNDYQESKDGSLEGVIEADGGIFSNRSGSESLVYWMNDGMAVKAIDASHYEGDLQGLFDKIMLHNSLFPETSYTVLGFGRDRGNTFRLIVKQKFVKGTVPTDAEIQKFAKDLELEKRGGWYYTKDGKRITDLNQGNVIKVGEKTFLVIDCDVEFTREHLNNLQEQETPFYLLKTPKGEIEIYGFIDPETLDMYLDDATINPEHPIHEYTHLWDRALYGMDPEHKLWNQGVKLMEKLKLWEEIKNSEQYGQKWIKKGITGDKLKFLIGSEVHSRLVGKEGEALLERISNEEGQKGLIGKLKEWILSAWQALKGLMSDWSDEEIQKLTLEDFVNMVVKDLADGVVPQMILKNQAEERSTAEQEGRSSNMETNGTQEKPEILSLPNFENLINNQQPIELTSSELWKVPLLEKLDDSISDSNTDEKNQEIVDEITTLIQSVTEDEYKQSTKKIKKTQEKINEYKRLNDQVNALKSNNLGLESYEIRHVAEQVVDSISDIITELQSGKSTIKDLFPDFKTDFNPKGASRVEIVTKIGIDNFINLTQERMRNAVKGNAKSLRDVAQFALLTKNWEALMTFAQDQFVANEGFGVRKSHTKKGFDVDANAKIDLTNAEDDRNDTDGVREVEGDAQEHWQVVFRTIDILNSMSEKVRMALHECYKIDKNGNHVMSKWGIPERVDKREAVQSIIRWTQGALTLNQMIEKLAAQQEKNPWLNQLLVKLRDKNQSDFQSQFFGVMNKHFQLYSIVRLKNGKYVSMFINEHPAQTELMQSVKAMHKMGNHPLFTNSGINTENLGFLHSYLNELNKIALDLREREKVLKRKDTKAVAQLTEEQRQKAFQCLSAASKILGFMIPDKAWDYAITGQNLRTYGSDRGMVEYLNDVVKSLDNVVKNKQKDYDPFKFKGENNISGSLGNFLKFVTDHMDNTTSSSFYDDGNMYQSYVIPSFMTKLMSKFHGTPEEVEKFINEEYGKSEWFFDKKNNRWRINWLQRALKASSDGVLSHKVELNFNKHSYMRTMTDAEYAVSLLSEYVAEASKGKTGEFLAWFRVPMLSNKPSSEFIRFYAFTGMNYKNDILDGMLDIFEQELSRIQTVRMRNKKKGDPGFIKNWDTNGRKFCFLPFLNEHLAENSSGELANLLKKKLEGKKELSAEQEKRLSDLVKEQIRNHIDKRVKSIMEEWDAMGILKAAEKVDNLGDNEEAIRNKVEEFLWNDTFASKMILQLTIGDIAFYKDAEDLQKRLAQIHAPGIRANVDAIDYAGNPVSADGKYRTFIIKDFDDFKSNIIANISEVFNRKIARARNDQERKSLEALKDSLVRQRTYKADGSVDDPGGAYWNINVADAQGYSSPTSYRKKAFMFGKWSREAEDIYQRLLNGDYDYTSLKVAFQPLKPFVYSRIEKSTDVAGAPITKIYSPFQAKNAEYLLIMADAIMRGEENKTGALSRPNLLKAIYDIMEDSAYDDRERDEQGKIIEQGTYNGKGIDTVQFESAIKSTLQSPINLHQFANKENGEREAYKHIRGIIYKNGKNTNKVDASDYDNVNSVHEVAFEDYCLQQEVPEHFKDHEQAHGSQIRMIIPSDLDYYYDPNRKDKDAEDNIVYYDVKQPDGKIKRFTASEFRAEYEKLISQNIEESLKDLAEELHINSSDKKERNIILSEFLQREIVDSPRYGIDLFQACSVDENGEFRIPLGDPIQAKRIEQLINSLIKNRVNKQKLPGGPVVQVSNFGTSKTLHIRFKDKAGNIIPLEDEYNPSEHDGKSYKQYLEENQAGIAYAEVYAPVYSDELIEKFGRPDGTIDVAAIEKLDPDLLTMVSYRIPTEDKYSCLPMKIVGFLPREAGEAIMLPYELTTIDGSDFDVDKRYIMRKDLKIVEDRNKKFKNLLQRASKSYASKHDGKAPVGNVKKKIIDGINMFLDNPEEMQHASKFDEWLYNELKDIREKKENIWKVVHDTTGRRARNNQIIDMTLAVLTHERTADKILNPGGFEEQKEMGYMVSAYKNPNNKKSWKDLEGVAKGKDGISELKKLSYVEKDLTWADTQVHFYHQNNAGSSLIGVFAVNKVAHATLGDDNIKANINYICGRAFNIAGFKFENDTTGGMRIDPMYDAEGNLIGKTLGSLVGASADTAKDPVLDLMNINMETAGMLTTMLRMGMPFRDAALFLSQDIITKALAEHSKRKLEKYVSIESVVQEWVSKYESNNKITDDSHIHEEELTREELIKGLKGEESLSSRYKVMKNFLRIKALANAMRRPTFATRFNSISSAVGPLVVDNLILEHKMEDYAMNPNFKEGEDQHQFIYEERDKDGKKTGKWIGCYLKDVFGLHPILNSFSKTVGMAHQMFEDMPTGSNGFKIILNTMTRLHGSGFTEKFFKNKKLLDQLSLFYQSAMLVQGGLIDSSRLNYYIEDFPKDFMDNKYKEKYADNALINAIRPIPSSNTDRTFLTISLTGLTSQEKERLSSAWDDLHKKDPKLSQDLFNYCFFRAGIGFSPKTFISLVDTYVKENLSGTDADGNKVSYVDIFRQMPSMNPEVLIDLFMRNNWDNKRIVPAIDTKDMSFIYSANGIEVHNDADKEKLIDTPYFTTEDKSGKTHLWKYEGERFDRLVYREVKLLGDNNEYVVILKDSKQLPTIESTGISEDTVNPDVDNSNIDGSEAEIQYYMESNPTEESEMSDDIKMKQNTSSVARGIAETSREMVMDIPGLDPSKIQRSEDTSNLNLSRFSKRLDAVLQEQGVTYDEKEVKEELDKYC